MRHRWRLFFVFVSGLVIGAVGTYVLGNRTGSEPGWNWVESDTAEVDKLRVVKAGWRRLTGDVSEASDRDTWGWMVELSNPTEEDWSGSLDVRVDLYDPEGLELARSDPDRSRHSIPAGQTRSFSRREAASPSLLRQVGRAAMEIRIRDTCPDRVSYDSLVALIGESAAQAERRGRVDNPFLDDLYCTPTRRDRVVLTSSS